MPAELRVTCDVCHGSRPTDASGWQQLLIGDIVGVNPTGFAAAEVEIVHMKCVILCSPVCRANWHEKQHRLARADRPTLPDLTRDR